MVIETNINRIEKLARVREKANWDFRCFLKSSTLSIGKIDSTVHRLYRDVSSRIECTSCANCCRVSLPLITKADVKRLSQAQGLSISAFKARYLQTDVDGEAETFNVLPCPFLKDNRCTVYEHRPADCRSFPHLHMYFLGSHLKCTHFETGRPCGTLLVNNSSLLMKMSF